MNCLVSYSESSDEDDSSTGLPSCRCPTEAKSYRSTRLPSYGDKSVKSQNISKVCCPSQAESRSNVGNLSNESCSELFTRPDPPPVACEKCNSNRKENSSTLPAEKKHSVASDDKNPVSQKVQEPIAERSTPGAIQELYESNTSHKKRKLEENEKQPLALPASIKRMYKDSRQAAIDKPALHQHRVRSFPHETGNWATHVYIPVCRSEPLVRLVERVMRLLLPGGFEILPEFHVSLSRTVVIRHHWIEPLVDSLRKQLQQLPTSICDIVDVKIFTNDEKTRTFVCLELSEEETQLLNYVRAVDSCFKDFKLAPYYENPSFHISVGWCLGDRLSSVSCDQLTRAKELLSEFVAAHPDLSVVYAHEICCRAGNKSFAVLLREASNGR